MYNQHRASLKNMPGHGGNRTYDLWNTSPMLCQLSYAVRSVRVCDISELNLVPSISMQSSNHDFFCVGVIYSGEYDVCDVTLSVYQHRASLKNMSGHGGNRTYDLWNTSPMLCQLRKNFTNTEKNSCTIVGNPPPPIYCRK